MMAEEIKIHVDYREKPTGICALLRQRQMKPEVCRLKWGDFIIDDTVTIERKSAEDFLISIIDGRLFRQAKGLLSNCVRPLFLVEGNLFQTNIRVDRRAVQGALLSIQTLWYIPILHARSIHGTADVLAGIGKLRVKAETGVVRSGYRPRRLFTRQLFFLQGLPGIGPKRARQLLECFGSVSRVLNASPEQLMQAPGIGEETASAIRQVLDTAADVTDSGS